MKVRTTVMKVSLKLKISLRNRKIGGYLTTYYLVVYPCTSV
ncbi:unnamed protein product [Heterobilharzia americana]|nr:unnamed protein product [Heterobilharzia americana]CAH8436477.1 unnamed protein product [Heterobilharzia americana]